MDGLAISQGGGRREEEERVLQDVMETLNLVLFIFAFQSAVSLTDKEGVLMYGSKFTQRP